MLCTALQRSKHEKSNLAFVFGAVAIVLVLGIPYNRGPSEEEKQVLSAFQKIQSDLYESGPTDAFGKQVSTAENILARLKQANGSQCVVNVLERSMGFVSIDSEN